MWAEPETGGEAPQRRAPLERGAIHGDGVLALSGGKASTKGSSGKRSDKVDQAL